MWNYLTVIYSWKLKKSLYLYTNQFDLILEYHLNNDSEYYSVEEQKIGGARVIGFKVLGNFTIRDMKYYHGTDKLSAAAALKVATKNKPKRWTSSYTGQIGRALNIEAIKKEFPKLSFNLTEKMLMNTSQGAIITSKTQEFKDVYCYDIVSAYPTILLGKVPKTFEKAPYKPSKNSIHFGKITITNFRSKHIELIPLYRGKDVPDDCVIAGKRIYAGLTYSYYGFIEHELRILENYYTFDSISISDTYKCTMDYLPKESIESIKSIYDGKLAAKGTEDYDGYKQMFNRIFGYFITTYSENGKLKVRDNSVPYQIGLWIISKQRQVMLDAIEAVGYENVVAAHTDGIKTCGNFDSTFNSINERRGVVYKNLGQWDMEEHIDRIKYLSNVKAKYEINGELKMKHGGISDDDIEDFIQSNTYDSITDETEISFTIAKKVCEDSNGIYIVLKRVLVPITAIE